MTAWWEIDTPQLLGAVPKFRAVAYDRHSAQDRQENSIPIQRDQVREWAEKNGVEIIREFADAGKSGLTSEGPPAFTEMMDEWGKKRNDFSYILCLDVSRWGRFQDIDLSAQFSAECKKHSKQVIYTTIGKPREDDPLYPVYGMIRSSLLRLHDDVPAAAESVACTRKEAYLQSLVENIARTKPDSMDFAREIKRLYDEGWGFEQLSRIICKTEHYIRDATRAKTSYVREAKTKENRFMALLSGINTL